MSTPFRCDSPELIRTQLIAFEAVSGAVLHQLLPNTPLPTVLFPVGDELIWRVGGLPEANRLLGIRHYLGSIGRSRFVLVGERGGLIVAAQVWASPTSRRLPSDGSWLELSRWCLTSEAGGDAGSRMHAWTVRWLREHAPAATTLVSYSDPSQGHTGAL